MKTKGDNVADWQYTSWQLKCPGEDNHQQGSPQEWMGREGRGGGDWGRGEEVGGTRGWGKLK